MPSQNESESGTLEEKPVQFRRLLLFGSPFILFLAMSWFLLQGLFNDPQYLPSARIDKPLPTFQLPSLHNVKQTLTEKDFTGEPALLNVWATWCPSCRVEHGMLNQLAEQGVVIYGLNYKDDTKSARHYLKTLGNPYRRIVVDGEGRFAFDLGVYGAPETYVLDAEGVVRYRHVGVVDENSWETILKPQMDALGFVEGGST